MALEPRHPNAEKHAMNFHPAAAARLLNAGRENRLEMRALFFPRNDGDFDVLKAGGVEKLMELNFAEAEPVIGVKLARAFEAVAK